MHNLSNKEKLLNFKFLSYKTLKKDKKNFNFNYDGYYNLMFTAFLRKKNHLKICKIFFLIIKITCRNQNMINLCSFY